MASTSFIQSVQSLFPAASFGSNAGAFGSNAGAFGSNAGAFGSNAGAFGSNAGAFGSNVGVFGSNAMSNCTLQGGQVKATASGQASVPSYTWVSRSNTGMYMSATQDITFSCHGANVLNVSSNGAIVYSSASAPRRLGIGLTEGTAPTHTLEVRGPSLMLGRVNVNDATDGGTARGISLWSNAADFAVYASATTSYSGGTACAGSDFSGTALRLRVANSATSGIIFENGSENRLLSMNAQTGETWMRGDLTILSDARYKSNLRVIDRALERVTRLTGYTFDTIAYNGDGNGNGGDGGDGNGNGGDGGGGNHEQQHDEDTSHYIEATLKNKNRCSIPCNERKGRRRTGLLAQDVQAVLPEAVVECNVANANTHAEATSLSVAYGNMVGLLVEAIKELQEKIQEIERKIEVKGPL